MAPPRKILRQQLEILIDFIEANKDMSKGFPPGPRIAHQGTKHKWAVLAKKLNAVPSGVFKAPDHWKKYWFEWRHKCRKKAANAKRKQLSPDASTSQRAVPLNDLEIRVLKVNGEGAVSVPVSSEPMDTFANDDSDADQKMQDDYTWDIKTRQDSKYTSSETEGRAATPPPKWAMQLEERRLAYEERMASALESIAATMKRQEERRGMAEERLSDAMASIAGSLQDINSGLQEVVQHIHHNQLSYNEPPKKEALETSINYWEDALAAFSLGARGGVSGTLALTSPEEAEFCREIQDLLQNAYLLQERCELLFLDQRSVLFRSESGGGGGGGGGEGSLGRTRLLSSHTASDHTKKEHHSSAESFASAEDQVADLREFDDLTESLPELENLELYQQALKEFESGIPYRTLRSDVVGCASEAEFACKLHCLRRGLRRVFADPHARNWFVDSGRQVLTDLLLFADKEPKEFLVAYEEMVSWTSDLANWNMIEKELSSKGVKVVSFYDVVLDFILLDAFEDLASPPASVLAVVRNRWLSDGFKESALTTAVWSVIKAKRRYLQFPDGFMAHFYSISEHLLPVLVWGFLGPSERLRDVCDTFQAEIVGFISDLFSFHKCRYTTVEELAEDIMQHARSRIANITEKLAERN